MKGALSALRASPDARKLLGMGFLSLFLELCLIRYLAGNVWNLGYFPNLVLIAVFVGMGLGFMLHQYASAGASEQLLRAALFALAALVAFVHFLHPTVPGFSNWQGDLGGDLYFTATRVRTSGPGNLPFVILLISVAAIFALLAQRTAKLFRRFPPLTAYTLDILGSCLGILAFMGMSASGMPAWVWFAIFGVGLGSVMDGAWRERLLPLAAGLFIVLLVRHEDSVLLGYPQYKGPLESHWSPYQRVQYMGSRGAIYVNGVGHQTIFPRAELARAFYQKVYDERFAQRRKPYQRVLVLGAGSGNDVAAALANGAEHVDAVEIDPAIADLGRRHHPEHPYQDPRVRLVIDDGRAFMSRSSGGYDLIVFALTDSLVKVSSMSQLRLENYLFTLESVRRARHLLAPGGDLVFYNYYRKPWLRTKIMQMVREGSGLEPRALFEQRDFAVLCAHDGAPAERSQAALLDLPSDDWPFLYLAERGIPSVYRAAMLGMALFALGLVALLHFRTRRLEQYREPGLLQTKLAFVFMGLAFLLLETKSVIQYSLLFGTTWLNSSLVFLAALSLVLLANFAAALSESRRWLPLVYVGLIGSCLLSLLWPLGSLLRFESGLVRFALASLLTFTPIFFANLIFSLSFRDQSLPEHLFGWNLIGATLGGVLEYSSMLFGYSFLSALVVLSYLIVLGLLGSARRARAPLAPDAALAGTP